MGHFPGSRPIEVLERAQQAYRARHVGEREEEIEEPEPAIRARTDLTAVDTSEWELPILRDVSRRPDLNEHLATVAQEAGSLALGAPR